jgi:hypothetical protein
MTVSTITSQNKYSDEYVKALLSKLAYEDFSTGFNFSNLDIVK